MSKRTQRRAEQRRINRIDRKQNRETGAVTPTVSDAQKAQAIQPENPATQAAMTGASSAASLDTQTAQAPSPITPETKPAAERPSHKPASPEKIAANRENATHSTGPRSEAGKATVSQNRTVHGLNYNPNTFRVLACENQVTYDDLLKQLITDHKPTDTTETILVTTMAQHRWLLDRANRLQERCFDQQTSEITDQKLFALYLRYATTHERAFHKCLADLLKLRSTRQKLEVGFESEKRRTDRHKHFLDCQEFDLQMTQTKCHMAQQDLRIAQRNFAREEKAQNAA